MSTIPTKETFENAYSGEAPWDIGKPQKDFTAVADQVSGSVLDAGCGTGDNAIFFAQKGCQVTGIDFLAEPIQRARKKASARGVQVDFQVEDALKLKQWTNQFDSVIDSGLFHTFSDQDRQKYVAGLIQVLKSGGTLFLMCFSDAEPGTVGPRRITQRDLQEAFADGWKIESIAPSIFALNPNFKGAEFSPSGPKAWFAVVKRV